MPTVYAPIMYRCVESSRSAVQGRVIADLHSVGVADDYDVKACKQQFVRPRFYKKLLELEHLQVASDVEGCRHLMREHSNYKICDGYLIVKFDVDSSAISSFGHGERIDVSAIREDNIVSLQRGSKYFDPRHVIVPYGLTLDYTADPSLTNYEEGVIAIDFDETLTIEHTNRQNLRSAYDEFCARRPDPEFLSEVSDNDILNNLRNPIAMKTMIEKMHGDGKTIAIVSMHDNPAWIKRCLGVLLGKDNPLLDEIKIIPLQSSPYDTQFGGSKGEAIKWLAAQEGVTLDNCTLIDDAHEEGAKLAATSDDDNASHINFIPAKTGNDKYLSDVGRVAKFSDAQIALVGYKENRIHRSKHEYLHKLSFFLKPLGIAYSIKDKFAAVDALVDSLSDPDIELDSKHYGALKQGELGKLVKSLNLDLNQPVSARRSM